MPNSSDLRQDSIQGAQLLADCLRFETQEEHVRRLSSLSKEDWSSILQQAGRMRVEQLVYGMLHRLPQTPPGLDIQVVDTLRRIYLGCLGRNLSLYHQLDRLLAALHEARIPVILLKGAHLARSVYTDIGMRPMADLDLLVHQEHLAQSAAVLESLGYLFDRPYRLQAEMHRHHHLPPYRLNDAVVELHWSLVSPLSPWEVDLAGLWNRAQPLQEIPPALGLSPVDLVLYLSLHLLQDEFAAGFKRIYEAALVLDHYKNLDISDLRSRAQAWGLEKGLFLTLFLAKGLFNAPVSAQLIDALQPADFTSEVAEMARRRILVVRPASPEMRPGVSRLLRRQPLRKKLRRLRMVLFSYPELVADQYGLPAGSKRVYFYYPVRWFEMSVEFLQQVFRLARGEEAAAADARTENLLNDWCMTP